MATRGEDQALVASFARQLGITSTSTSRFLLSDTAGEKCRIVPSFGWHPWFSHQIYDDSKLGSRDTIQAHEKVEHYRRVISPAPEDEYLQRLPSPRSLSNLMCELRAYLEEFPYALVGEVGLDRSFRLPENLLPNVHTDASNGTTPGGREGRRLTPHRVKMDHQRKILKAQLNLAGEMQRPVSVHGVAAHGILFEALQETWKGYEHQVLSKREQKSKAAAANRGAKGEELTESVKGEASSLPFPPRICLHSYSGPPDTLRQYFHPSVPCEIFCSFSVLVNLKDSTAEKTLDVIKAVPDDRILVESDLHRAGDRMDELLEQMVRCVCDAKIWSLEEGVRQLGRNWSHFVFGKETQNDR